ncbi:MAG: DegT/DnrJ/EryC1/StrS family aminotransferase [Actinomycetota bacterium]|nr:DegT/DnrJ/EryC1/StrS family aminotransferase [Actinomycetota bacterium]
MAVSQSTWRVPLSDIAVDDALSNAGREVLESGWWSMGPRVAQLESDFSAFSGAPHSLAVSSGTAALHLALLAVGCGAGDEVVLPSLNFVAAANTVASTGATPVFCDILGPDDLNLDPRDLEAAIGPKTKAVIVLHYGGYPCDLASVLEIADRHGVAVIEDAAHAIGANWNGRAAGTIGAVGCFSFFANKNLAVGEGGMVVTSDEQIAERVRLLRSHGMTTLTWQRHTGHASSYDVVAAGFNYRLDELRSALASVQLERLPAANAARLAHVRRYRELLDGVAGVSFPFPKHALADSSHHLAVALLPEGVSREAVRTHLQAERIQTSVHYPPIHRFTLYSDARGKRHLRRTDAIAERILTLPLFPHMRDDDLTLVAETLEQAVRTD